jgi:hypothetical protein
MNHGPFGKIQNHYAERAVVLRPTMNKNPSSSK